MVTNVITVGPEASVRDAAKILLANRISALPVIDEQGHLVGIISEGVLGKTSRVRYQPSSLLVVGNFLGNQQGGRGEEVRKITWSQSKGRYDRQEPHHREAKHAA